MQLTSANKNYWEQAAHENAYFHIATSRTEWTTDDFLRDGQIRFYKWVLPWLLETQEKVETTTLLEIGCGAGRFGHHIAPYVQNYIGLDISEEMLRKAETLMSENPNKRFVLGDGTSLSGIEDASIDAVFSYAVLQHIYEREVVLNYLRETARVLRSGGVAKLQMLGSNAVSGLKMRFVPVAQLDDQSLLHNFLYRVLRKLKLTKAKKSLHKSSLKTYLKDGTRTLPGDFLVPRLSRYHAGVHMRGEGVDYREAVALFEQAGCQAEVENFESLGLADKYWLLVRKH